MPPKPALILPGRRRPIRKQAQPLRVTQLSGFGAGAQAFEVPPPDDPAANPDFANVKLLVMNGDGTEGNQDMVDKGATGHTITWLGQAQMDTGIEKFTGKPTLLLDGVSDGIRVPDHADFNSFGTQDFTIEAWVYPTWSGTTQIIVGKWGTTGKRAWRIFRHSNSQFVFHGSADGTSTTLEIGSGTTLSQDTWAWVVVQREGNDFTLWIDGVRATGPITDTLSIHGGGTEQVRIGIESSSVSEFKGNFAPMRITVGEAIHPGAPANIGVPIGPHPES